MADSVKTAAVILNYKDNDNTLRLASEFEAYDLLGLTVIVDNSGKDGLNTVSGSKTKLLHLRNGGYSRGNNAGLAAVDQLYGADYVIISNPDVFVEYDAVKACVDFLKNNKDYAVAAPRMHAADGTPHHLAAWKERTFLCDLAYSSGILSRTVGMYRECYPESYFDSPVVDVDCTAGSFFVARRDILKRGGDFDENTFLYYEEDILGCKLKRLGFKTALLCNYKFLHYEGSSVNKNLNYLRKYRAMQKSRLYFHRQYLKTPFPKYFLLLLATGLGTVEKSLKTLYFKIKK